MDPSDERQWEREAELEPEEEEFWERLSPYLVRDEPPGLCMSEATAEALERIWPPEPLPPHLDDGLDDIYERAGMDLEFDATLTKERAPSLGGYLAFLRRQAALSIEEAASEADLDRHQLRDLEEDRVHPREIPSQALAALVRRLKGSLERTQALIMGTVKAPRYVYASGRGSLYRGAKGAGRSASEAASLTGRQAQGERSENPAYREEVEAATQRASEFREAWRKLSH